MKQNNSLVVYTGPMFSGKTSRMLLEVEKCRHAGYEIHAFKPLIDDRYADSQIVTHMGWSFPAKCVSSGEEISKIMLSDVKDSSRCLVVVDELFMIPGSAEELIWLYKQGVNVAIASIDLSYSCEPFEEVTKILPWATRVEKYASACSVCGNDAYYTYRKVDGENSLVLVGGNDLYESRCRKHHPFLQEVA